MNDSNPSSAPGSRVHIRSIQVGTPTQFGSPGAADPMDRPWSSAIVKTAVDGPVRVGKTNIEGDRQADLKHHGGPDKAVLAYAAAHYPTWRADLPSVEFPRGAFGENLTVDGSSEWDVAIGDVWRAGAATFQVSQPRQPCWKLARRLRVEDMVLRVQESLRTGWYLRVLEEGEIQAGDALSLVRRPYPEWTVAEASRVMYGVRSDPASALELASLDALSASWKRTLTLRASGERVDTSPRVKGPGS